MGGVDGFGTSFNTAVIMRGYSVTLFGDAPYPASQVVSTASDANTYGAGFTFQDKGECWLAASQTCTDSLNVRSGQEVLSFKGTGTCKTVYGFSKYGHTWSSTRVAGVGIGIYSVSTSMSLSSSQWPSASQPGNAARVC